MDGCDNDCWSLSTLAMPCPPYPGLRPRDIGWYPWNSTEKRLVSSCRLSAAFPSLDLLASLACVESLRLYNVDDARDSGSEFTLSDFDFTFRIS
jgi:hypothetical protein